MAYDVANIIKAVPLMESTFKSAINNNSAMIVATVFIFASGKRQALVCDGRSLVLGVFLLTGAQHLLTGGGGSKGAVALAP